MKQIILAATFLGVMLVSTIAEAQPRQHRNMNEVQRNQQHRIKQGKHSGQLTKMEARRLHMQQAKIRHYKQMAKADGRVNRRERKLIRHEQMIAGRSIYHQKHDGQRRHDGQRGGQDGQMRRYRHSR